MSVKRGQEWKNKHTGDVVEVVQVLEVDNKHPVAVVEFKFGGGIEHWVLNGIDGMDSWYKHWDRV